MRRKILSSALMIVALLGTVVGSALAIFRDSEYIHGNSISAGSINISLTDGASQFPSPIVAENLTPGQWTEWSTVFASNDSNTGVDVYFYVKDVEGAACTDTVLEVKTAAEEEVVATTWPEEPTTFGFSGNIYDVKGASNKVAIDTLAMGEVAEVLLRAGLSEEAGAQSMGNSCSWTGVFVAEPALVQPEEPEEPPVSGPVSFPETF